MKRYKRARCNRAHELRRFTVTSKVPSARNLIEGTATLATKMSSAMSHAPDFQNSTTPCRIVLVSPRPNMLVYITGNVLEGTYRISAAIRNAQVRASESGLRRCKRDRHRGQRGISAEQTEP